MKNKSVYFLVSLILTISVCAIKAQAQDNGEDGNSLTLMSLNIRMNYQDDGPNNWEFRREYMTDLINHYRPDLLGAQECYYPQYTDMVALLPEYESFGPVEGRQGAESVAVFYLRDNFSLADSGTFWLSQTPEKQSIGWDANLRRTVTWGEFDIASDDLKVYFFVTHFDHKGQVAREESTKLLLQKVNEIAGDHDAFIVGDFNLRDESNYYDILTSGTGDLSPFYDTKKLAEKYYGPSWTLQDFGKMPVDKRPKIDYIFANKRIRVLSFVNIADQRGDVFPSDHNPQMAIVEIQ